MSDNSDRLETDTGRGKTKKRGNFRTIKSILFLQCIIRPVTIRHKLLKIKTSRETLLGSILLKCTLQEFLKTNVSQVIKVNPSRQGESKDFSENHSHPKILY